MASVRMSERLRDELLQGVEEKFKIANPKPTTNTTLSNVVLQALLEFPAFKKAADFVVDPDIHKLATSNRDSTLRAYLQEFRKTSVVRQIIIKGFVFNNKEQDFVTEFAGVPPTMHFVVTYNQTMVVHIKEFPQAQQDVLNAAMTQAATELLDWTERHKTFMDSARDLIKASNTVGQFLDAWPEAESLLSNEVRQKLNTQSKSTKDLAAAEVRAKFDAAQASPTLLVAQIVQSAIADPNKSTP
jgi:hypothetical protein